MSGILPRLLKKIVLFLFVSISLLGFSLSTARANSSTDSPDPTLPDIDTTPPVIDVWYGPHQVFGKIGLPQQWINVLGNVSDPECGSTALKVCLTLTYTLNGIPGSLPLKIGSDQRRLYGEGDFDIEIDINSPNLVEGNNILIIAATNPAGLQSRYTVSVDFYRSNTWHLPYSIDWSTVTNIQDVVQVVDGKWRITPLGIQNDQVAYDRILAIGDLAWDSFEILVPVTFHFMDPIAWTLPNSTAPGLGIIIRWLGHTDTPVWCEQPHCGWLPEGGSAWYEWLEGTNNILRLNATPPPGSVYTTSIQFRDGHTYWFRVRVEADPNGNLYSMKVWENGLPEPGSWTRQRLATLENLSHGSLLLVAHHVSATFGNITVSSLNPSTYPLTIQTVGNGSVAKNPNQATYSKFQRVTLTAVPDPGWSFSHWSGDLSSAANPVDFTVSGNRVITATYTQVEFPLTLTIEGSGTVNKTPDKPTYHFNEAVTLTATGNPGWKFAGWSGDLSGMEPQRTITITRGTHITAVFIPIKVLLPIIKSQSRTKTSPETSEREKSALIPKENEYKFDKKRTI